MTVLNEKLDLMELALGTPDSWIKLVEPGLEIEDCTHYECAWFKAKIRTVKIAYEEALKTWGLVKMVRIGKMLPNCSSACAKIFGIK